MHSSTQCVLNFPALSRRVTDWVDFRPQLSQQNCLQYWVKLVQLFNTVLMSYRAKGVQTFVPVGCWLHQIWKRARVLKEFPSDWFSYVMIIKDENWLTWLSSSFWLCQYCLSFNFRCSTKTGTMYWICHRLHKFHAAVVMLSVEVCGEQHLMSGGLLPCLEWVFVAVAWPAYVPHLCTVVNEEYEQLLGKGQRQRGKHWSG